MKTSGIYSNYSVNSGNSKVGGSQVVGNGQTVHGGSTTYGDNKVYGEQVVTEGQTVTGGQTVHGDTTHYGNDTTYGNQTVGGDSHINGNQVVDKDQTVGGDSHINGNQVVDKDQTVGGDSHINGNQVVDKDQTVGGDSIIKGHQTVHNGQDVYGEAKFHNGLSAEGNKITNVSDGRIAADSLDAVNGRQLNAAWNQINKNTVGIADLNHRVDNLDSRIDKVGAGAAALAALHPLDFDPDAKWDFAAGYGNYGGENAVAVGTFYRPNEDTMFSVGGTFGNDDNMINAGVSFKIGAGSSHVTTSRTAMAKEIKSMRDIVAKQDAQIQKLTAMVNALVGVQTETDTRRPCSRMYRKTTGHTKLSQPWLRAAWSRAIRTANSRATAT